MYQYVSDFRTRLSKACDLAKENFKTSNGLNEKRFDKNAVSGIFNLVIKFLSYSRFLDIPFRLRILVLLDLVQKFWTREEE